MADDRQEGNFIKNGGLLPIIGHYYYLSGRPIDVNGQCYESSLFLYSRALITTFHYTFLAENLLEHATLVTQ